MLRLCVFSAALVAVTGGFAFSAPPPASNTGRYCQAVEQNIDRVNQGSKNQELTLPPENRNSPRNQNYKPSNGWKIFSCDEGTDPNRVGGMIDMGGGTLWYFEALKSAYPFSKREDIRADVCSGAALRDDNILEIVACHASGELHKMCESSPGLLNCNAAPDARACARRNSICAQELGPDAQANGSRGAPIQNGSQFSGEIECRSVGAHLNGEPISITRRVHLQGDQLYLTGRIGSDSSPERQLACISLHAGILCERVFGPVTVTIMTNNNRLIETITDPETGREVAGAAYECSRPIKMRRGEPR
jgi:hypothetical protein